MTRTYARHQADANDRRKATLFLVAACPRSSRRELGAKGGADLEAYHERAQEASAKHRQNSFSSRHMLRKCFTSAARLAAYDAWMEEFVADYDAQEARKLEKGSSDGDSGDKGGEEHVGDNSPDCY
ncbi:hypothetical protein C8J57DRAFT_1227010 [Mycena rebaudengoi]|nr:hypothetical protein C8J57DRAFT_1227010 [Mycena rebaudengoi]